MPGVFMEKWRNGGKRLYRIGVVSAMWQRLELTDLVFSHIADMKTALAPFMELLPVVAGSEGEESRAVAEKNGFSYIETENLPLGAKWNAALSLLRDQDVDGVVILGSDDLLNDRFFHVLKESLEEGYLLAGLDTFFVLESRSGRLMEWLGYLPPREGESIGAGRFLHRELLERLNWHLWEDGLNAGLDASMWRLLRADADRRGQSFTSRTINCRKEGIVLVDVKSSTQFNGLENLALSSGRVRMVGAPRQFLEKSYPRKLVEKILSQAPAAAELPDLTIDTLSVFPPCDTSKVPVYVLLPCIPDGVAEFASHQLVSFLGWLRTRGEQLELWVEKPQDFLRNIDCGLIGLDMRTISDGMLHLPPQMRKMVVCGGWSSMSTPASIVRRLRRVFPSLHVTADLRFSGKEEARLLASLADAVLPGPETPEAYGPPMTPCTLDRHIPFIDFVLREHAAAFMEHEDAMKDVMDIVEACATIEPGEVPVRLYLSFSANLSDIVRRWGFHTCKSSNMQMFYRIFKVCIVPPRCHNPGICAEILAAGTPLLCHVELAHSMGLGEEDGVLAFSSWEEALYLTSCLCTKQRFWEQMAERAWKTGEQLIQASETAYAGRWDRDNSPRPVESQHTEPFHVAGQ